MIIRLMDFKFYWQKPVLDFTNYFSQPTQNIFETCKNAKKMQKNPVVHRTFFTIKSDWFHTCKLKDILTKQHSFNFQCFGMTIQTKRQLVSYSFFFLSGFSSQTLTIHRTAAKGRGPSFIPLYHFHPLTNIETFICNFACEMTIKYF